jgi:hypothetical protein
MRKKPPASFEIRPHCQKSAGRLFGHGIPRRITILRTRSFRQIAIENLRKRLVNRTALRRRKQRVKGFYARRPWSSRCIERNKQRGEGWQYVHHVSLLLYARGPNAQDLPSSRLILRFYDGDDRAQKISWVIHWKYCFLSPPLDHLNFL